MDVSEENEMNELPKEAMTDEGTDWAWCYENPREAAKEIDRLTAALSSVEAKPVAKESHTCVICGWTEVFVSGTAQKADPIRDRIALETACEFIEKHIAPRRCDSPAVSECWRCKSVYLAKRMRDMLAAPLALVEAQSRLSAQGFRLVPIEPTPEMVKAARDSDTAYSLRNFGPGVHFCQSGEDHWSAMIAAAPQCPQPQAEPSPEVKRVKNRAEELWPLIDQYASCRIDCDRSSGAISKQYLKLSESVLRAALSADGSGGAA